MGTPLEASAVLLGDEVRPYRIHVSSKYLDLTRRKLELTRLPHEASETKSHEWWEPKPLIEPLIDYWLEKYDWREQERAFNDRLPQFRTAVPVPGSDASVRLHFIHVRSPHDSAVPLLLIPPFPFTNLALGHLVQPLTEPEDPASQHPFHLVIPSLPGLGFSDALPGNTAPVPATADVLNRVMERLSYGRYVASNAACAASSPARIDWALADRLARHHADSCVGTHFINPPLAPPTLRTAPLEWAKWSVASFLRAPVFGYHDADFRSLDLAAPEPPAASTLREEGEGVLDPNTPSFALCDSPVGLLALVLRLLRTLGAQRAFSPAEVVTLTQTAWLPGPESALRFWAHCRLAAPPAPRTSIKPKVAITVFSHPPESSSSCPRQTTAYACPAWANAGYTVLRTRRVVGSPGLLAWDAPEHILHGVRGLAARLRQSAGEFAQRAQRAAAVPLDRVVVHGAARGGSEQPATASWRLERIREASETPSGGLRADADFGQPSPDTIVVTPPGDLNRVE
ncbi:Epoxide hydrolase 1 [Colletotrichum orbiculare MAFF 240422]|uniref:Epoxide hydrolase 1 n=1 Tax=Colletotrichum orbiculare (strain 104-T / ATCC 96160 / CBS 514.97 / LARS 414 / MAFF 240422) TaxID=1213857 RepID=N4UTZ3_COLOR|nr:Epoxide hydrolase 1 [Colletotrichum orbiculare MAFF 240422]